MDDHSKDSKKSPPMSVPITHHWNLKFFRGLKSKKDQKFGIWAPEVPIMKNMDFVIGTLYEVKAELGAPSSSSVPI
jgi:hypothetical protein